MTLSLRERRRQETARAIQLVTLQLAVQHGLENVTTEEIAASAGISTRTFFNYFTNKEAAAIGAPPAFREKDKEALREGTGSLAKDLKVFLDRHMEILAEDEPILEMIGTVLRSNERARGILEGFLNQERRELTECLCSRVNDRQTAAALACMTIDAITETIYLWEHEDNLTLGAALDAAWKGMITAAHLLVISSD
ncbi:TetR family transcriptional regulator [Paralimibaculum aggregatum]|uniref:TetR family transcriptional regulator n=1 Tax=Paralimibaculum aggregatum TaxID=3036245 RepID=A0ABQ6LU26_9RHOB|nr:TetR/AcrR family transcriptional regulator [Limibaculum sp. NKW23]GMG85586.1 TetR family transcriptional regulator [Limibaculum sp. NKW23]